MATIKDAVISLVQELPDDVSIEDIMYHLYVKQKILRGKQQLAAGQFRPHEEVKDLAKEWLK